MGAGGWGAHYVYEILHKDRSPRMCVFMDSKLRHVDCHVMPADSSYKDITCRSD